MSLKITALAIVLLFAVFAVNVLAGNCPANGYITNCGAKTTGVCANFYTIDLMCCECPGVRLCQVAGTNCVGGGAKCVPQCVVGGRQSGTCDNYAEGSCADYYQTGATDALCYYYSYDTPSICEPAITGGGCGATCIPEFFGIEFNEMQLSTGIIALIAAIALPMALFRKK